MNEVVRWGLGVLAVYRLAQLVVYDDGPMGVIDGLRRRLMQHESRWVRGMLGELVQCPYCVGMWAALVVAALILWPTAVGDLALTVLGLAGGAAVVEYLTESGRPPVVPTGDDYDDE